MSSLISEIKATLTDSRKFERFWRKNKKEIALYVTFIKPNTH